ncbi:Peptidoglycan glycosyltransferase MrdB [Tepidimonas fonticaldi]|uniref:Peptidoglycan glycosyltransferase MrdB n=1 Tax=Tepidimonas fonticaldi TaxID=1101373 RepID=A0A1A6DY55_9BURK|nr:rod shape-determining protein RodA [Tepidimonas fonticaldi]OBS31783.1 rod shape-determining protein RodA [Tepidimonas fonticaldi]TSE36376.1 Peptidoglycan glycosyltransferase MrdB [Tepidimonas fonticaldi]
MAVVIEKPPVLSRIAPLVRGFDGQFLLAVALLAAIGQVVMYSVAYDIPGRYLDHLRNLLIAAGAMLVVSQIPPQRLQALAVPAYVAGVVLLIAVELFGLTRKGAQRWLDLGVITIQPSELMKIAMPLMLAWWFQRREGRLGKRDFLAAGALLAVPVGLILKQPDLGTALLVLASGLFVIFFAGLSWKLIVPPLVLGAVGVVTLIVMEPQWCAPGVDWVVLHEYQRQRVCTLLDPAKDPLGKGFHILQGMIAIGSGGLWGKGFMEGTQTHLDFVPERSTDFIFAAFSEEFGFLGVLGLLAAYTYFVARGLMLAAEASTLFGRLLAGALILVQFVYAFVNMGMVSGILPVVGVPLPFLSYGGTAMVSLGASLGMILSVGRYKRLVPA